MWGKKLTELEKLRNFADWIPIAPHLKAGDIFTVPSSSNPGSMTTYRIENVKMTFRFDRIVARPYYYYPVLKDIESNSIILVRDGSVLTSQRAFPMAITNLKDALPDGRKMATLLECDAAAHELDALKACIRTTILERQRLTQRNPRKPQRTPKELL